MSVEPRLRGGQTVYLARWRDPDGRARSKTFARKVDAVHHERSVQTEIARGAYVDRAARLTVAEYARQWVDGQPHRTSSRINMRKWISNRLDRDPLGGLPLVKVRQADVRAWARRHAAVTPGTDARTAADRGAGLAPLTMKIQTGYLRSLFAAAMHEEPPLRATNPVPPLSRLPVTRAEAEPYVPLTVGQVRALAAEAWPRQAAMVLAQAGLGLRLGELLALRVQDVDFLHRKVRVVDQLEQCTLRRVPPKTARSRRTVPLPGWLAEVLAEHVRRWPPAPDGLLFTVDPANQRTRRAVPDNPWAVDHSLYQQMIKRAVARAGLPPGTSSHDLRHHYASMLIMAGQSVFTVAEMLGHASATLVLTTYGHMMPGSEDGVRQAIEAAWSAPEYTSAYTSQ